MTPRGLIERDSRGNAGGYTATPAGTQRTAEHFRLTGAGITSIMLIFDGTPWQPMLAMMGQAPDTATAKPSR
jgi:hypothetical protein